MRRTTPEVMPESGEETLGLQLSTFFWKYRPTRARLDPHKRYRSRVLAGSVRCGAAYYRGKLEVPKFRGGASFIKQGKDHTFDRMKSNRRGSIDQRFSILKEVVSSQIVYSNDKLCRPNIIRTQLAHEAVPILSWIWE